MKNQIKKSFKLTGGTNIFVLLLLSIAFSAIAAPLSNTPISLTQPSGNAKISSARSILVYLEYDANGGANPPANQANPTHVTLDIPAVAKPSLITISDRYDNSKNLPGLAILIR